MSNAIPGKFNYLRSFMAAMLLTVGVVGIAVWMTGGDLSHIGEIIAQSRLHPPHFDLIAQSSLATQIHLSAACSAFLIGLYQLMGPKGHTPHRVLGYIWLCLMLTAAISSFWLKGLNHGAYSFIHILSGWTVVVTPMILYAARTKNIKRHRDMATGLFMGGLVVAGLFAFIPGRLLWRVFFG
ncbi:DUF2306 domain-containing protein [Asticcacaulis sp. BYS171W]|uniref:DUF2306 domain-containing protein n=1 Tax=Asticcacaulis aquaticus TaxID=2984212 RepID=A0ABT5HRD3_9CAUL|nr:DUF2306 domain-containing protein [Asticcacaulis aquaticus]MDC7682635.1 DUF2306 domain-containing protein [Asticcacaulis aquaticus]